GLTEVRITLHFGPLSYFVVLFAGASLRKFSIAVGNTSSTRSTSASLLNLPKLKRIAPRASSSLRPSARITGDGSSEPDEHAEPVETATPCMSRLISKPSPSIRAKERLEIFG